MSTPTINGSCDGVNAYTSYDPNTVMAKFTGGVIAAKDVTDADNSWNAANNRFSDAAAYVTAVTGTSYIKRKSTDLATMYRDDETMLAEMKKEYCHYFNRYKTALTTLYQKITAATPPSDTPIVLANTILLNRRVNALIEVMDYMANKRIEDINLRKAAIDTANAAITNELSGVSSMADALKKDAVLINSQKEMIRYTQEKNNHIENQISMWAALNIVAIASIFYIYRKM